jgi:hypothetical protein
MEAVRFSFAARNAIGLHYILVFNNITLQSVMAYSVDGAQSTATVA